MSETPAVPPKERRFKPVPARFLLPNLVTLLALSSGVTAIRWSMEGHYEWAVYGIIFAIVLDAMDGRIARLLQGTSRFGAELDSLADFVNFGVAPAIMVYFWTLNTLHNLGWLICLMFAISGALRLARFNVALDDPNKPAWAGAYFTGVPAPAGAMLALLPLYLGFLGFIGNGHEHAGLFAAYLVLIGGLMMSRIPTFSGKNFARIPREYVLPILFGLALAILLLVLFPWESLLAMSIIYLSLIPVSVLSYRRRKRRDKV
ncbi:MAG: CDP-diacylglycerol--serine O-phosphatidyltransferase [Aestuariivirga sp.]